MAKTMPSNASAKYGPPCKIRDRLHLDTSKYNMLFSTKGTLYVRFSDTYAKNVWILYNFHFLPGGCYGILCIQAECNAFLRDCTA